MKYFLIVAIALLLAACKQARHTAALPFYNTPDFTPVWLAPGDVGYARIHTIAPFSFTNQLGRQVTNGRLSGKIYAANFFFASCGSICPKMMDNLKAVQTAFAKDNRVRILSHSVTPMRDSVPVLNKYAADRGINSARWWLLTGERKKIYALARRSYFADNETGVIKPADVFLHTENVILIDGHGRIRGVYNGTLPLEIQNLISDIKILELER